MIAVAPRYVRFVQDYVDIEVAGGYADREEIIEDAVELAMDEALDAGERLGGEAIRSIAAELVDRALSAHAERQASWPAVTDCDRLTAAFTELERSGIVARENFSCCTTCGVHEIGEEVERLDGVARGYTFFHEQDTEGAAEAGHPVFLSYGATRAGGGDPLAVGHEVVATLRRHGLDPHWNGDLARKIEVPLDWKRRRTVPA
ncbi:MAG TPA: hypothetical protein VFT95_14725 [Micromonosporaceae bacterium]|nr:hypothetical protein [Micromonosporaceae bacterium]